MTLGVEWQAPYRWMLLVKKTKVVNLLAYGCGDIDPRARRAVCSAAVSHEEVVSKKWTLTSPLSDRALLAELELSAEALFNLPASELALDFKQLSESEFEISAIEYRLMRSVLDFASAQGVQLNYLESEQQALQRAGDKTGDLLPAPEYRLVLGLAMRGLQ